jgi:uncharacterized membrane protein YphA (DoxX/SURF4 family)
MSKRYCRVVHHSTTLSSRVHGLWHDLAMFTVLVVVVVLLTLVCVGSSVADVRKMPRVVEAMDRLRVPLQLRPLLPVLKLLGAAGLLIGLAKAPLGAVAAVCLAAYFAVATWYHGRAKDAAADTGPAAALCVLAVAAAVLRLVTT